jgi:hypothetical protein
MLYLGKEIKITQDGVKKYRQPPYKNWAAYIYLQRLKLTFFIKATASFAAAHVSIT